jgi:signal peptidase II
MIFIIVSVVLSLDQSVKYLVNTRLSLGQSIPVAKGIFHITLVHNRGAAFGILQGALPFFIFSASLAIYLIYLILKDVRRGMLSTLAMSLVLAGALGNLIDRVFLGYVIDFLDFRIWPVFNIADSSITIGAVLLGWFMLSKKEPACRQAGKQEVKG